MLTFRKVTTLEEAQIVRVIRNSGRHNMTKFTDYIEDWQQEHWWFSRKSGILYIFSNLAEEDVAFSYINPDAGWNFFWITLAVADGYRGFGYGTEVYRQMSQLYPDQLYAEILINNFASITAAIRAGFTIRNISKNKYILSNRSKF